MRAALIGRTHVCTRPGSISTRISLRARGRSLIAAPLSRPPFTSPAGVMVLFAVRVGGRNIWSGPEDRHGKVDNGLTWTRAPRPAAPLPAPSPWGDAYWRI